MSDIRYYFKAGTILRCVNDEFMPTLSNGTVYVATERAADSGMVYVVDDQSVELCCFSWRFTLIIEP